MHRRMRTTAIDHGHPEEDIEDGMTRGKTVGAMAKERKVRARKERRVTQSYIPRHPMGERFATNGTVNMIVADINAADYMYARSASGITLCALARALLPKTRQAGTRSHRSENRQGWRAPLLQLRHQSTTGVNHWCFGFCISSPANTGQRL